MAEAIVGGVVGLCVLAAWAVLTAEDDPHEDGEGW